MKNKDLNSIAPVKKKRRKGRKKKPVKSNDIKETTETLALQFPINSQPAGKKGVLSKKKRRNKNRNNNKAQENIENAKESRKNLTQGSINQPGLCDDKMQPKKKRKNDKNDRNTINQPNDRNTINQPNDRNTINQPNDRNTINQPNYTNTINRPCLSNDDKMQPKIKRKNYMNDMDSINQPCLIDDDKIQPKKKRKNDKNDRNGSMQKKSSNLSTEIPKLNVNHVKRKENDRNGNMQKRSNNFSAKIPKLNVNHIKRKDNIKEIWGGDRQCGKLWKDTGVEVIKDPFSCCFLPSFLNDSNYLSSVKEELAGLEMITKNNDLYKFHQTTDLKNVTSPHIAGLRHFLYGEFREWLIQVTGIPLSDKVDMGCSKYEYTDVLLCHDDELEGRRIAYILYLVPPWSQEDGGSLDLFTTDKHGHPSNIVRSLVPEWNAFAFFEVSPVSFHQVSEVLSQDKVRLSINGWFHGPPIEHPERHLTPPTPFLPGHIEEEDVYAWVNHIYLDQATQQQIRRKFRTESAIELDNFVTEDKYEELSKALKEGGLPWKRVGPANKQSIDTVNIAKAPEVVRSCAELLKSEAMFLILSQLTGLKLHKLAPPDSEPDSDDENEAEPNPRITLSVHQWGHGSYTLVRDDCVEASSALDAHLFLNVAESWSQELGGFVSYITKNEDEELLTVLPRTNCLALVYKDAETLKFTKHINASVLELGEADNKYHTFSSVYYE